MRRRAACRQEPVSAMSLSADEYREHLATTAVRAGFNFDGVVLPQGHYAQVGGMRLHYLDWGNEHLPPMVFLHGGALTAHTWDLVCLALRGEYHCIALDQRGHGDSGWAEDADYSIAAQLTDTTGFVDKLGLDKFILVGMSLGAINALAYAIAHPERLTNLVIIDAGPEMRRPGSSRIRDFVNDSEHLVSVEAIIERALQFNPRRDPTILRRSLMHNLRQQPDGTWKWKYDRSRFQRLDNEAHRAERAGLADGLARITCPTLVVRGGESDVFHEEDAERLVARLPDGRRVTIARAGHTVQGDNPKDLVAELRRFLAADN
jgi:esterase